MPYDFNQLRSVFLLLRFLLEFAPSRGLSVKHLANFLPHEVDKLHESGATPQAENVPGSDLLRTRLATVTRSVNR